MHSSKVVFLFDFPPAERILYACGFHKTSGLIARYDLITKQKTIIYNQGRYLLEIAIFKDKLFALQGRKERRNVRRGILEINKNSPSVVKEEESLLHKIDGCSIYYSICVVNGMYYLIIYCW